MDKETIGKLLDSVGNTNTVIDILQTVYRKGWLDAKETVVLARKYGVVLS